MTTLKRTLLGLIALGLLAGVAQGAGSIGDKAAPLKIEKWVQGAEVDLAKADKNKVYVIEFWATWCAPCRVSIPHLTELQEKHKDKLVIIGVSDEDVATVEKFVKEQGDKMDYTIAVDDDRKTSKGYMEAFEIRGIPHAFIVKQGAVVYHNHPLDPLFDEVLTKALEPDFGLADAKKIQAEAERRQKRLEELSKMAMEYVNPLVQGSIDDKAAHRKMGQKFVEMAKDEPMMLNEWAWFQLDTLEGNDNRDMELIVKAAKTACEATEWKDAGIIDTYARALFDTGERSEAIKWQKKAVELAADADPRMQDYLKETLERYQKAVNPQS